MTNKIQQDGTLSFGKYKGLTLLDIAYKDPNYIFWLSKNGVIKDIPRQVHEYAHSRRDEITEERRQSAIEHHNLHQKYNSYEYQRRGSDLSNWYDMNGL